MSNIALEMSHVSKKFKRGEIHDSLRDLIPAFTGKFLSSTRAVCLKPQEFWALNDVSFQVERGEAFGVIGSNGAGKSTILKLLSGIMKPTLGDIAVSGKLSALIEVGAGFHPDLTGRENIFLNGTILGMKRDEIRRKFDEIVEFSGLAEFIDTPVKRYSSGMYARLGFSVAAHVDPEILIVDEVLSVGDWAFQTKCMQKMTSVISAGATIIFVSHNLKAVVSLCKRSALLERGRIAELGLTNQVISRYIKATAISQERPLENEIRIRHIAMRDNRGGNLQFEPGQKVWVDISMSSTVNCRNLSVVLGIRDDNYYQVFNTASERLGYKPISMEVGELRVITFELTLHLAPGIYHLGLALKRYDINRLYDERSPALTFFVNSDDQDIRGVVNLYPKIVEDEVTNGFKERSKETFVRSSH